MFPFKACVEDQLQRLADALTVSLRNAVLSNFKAVDAFLEDSMEKLSRRPRTIDDIGEVRMHLDSEKHCCSYCCNPPPPSSTHILPRSDVANPTGSRRPCWSEPNNRRTVVFGGGGGGLVC